MPIEGQLAYDPTVWDRRIHTTMVNHLPEIEEPIRRNYQLGALLEQSGRVLMNQGGNGFDWRLQYKFHRARGANGENPRAFDRVNLWKTAVLEYRGFEVTDSITRREILANQGEAALIKVMNGFMDRLKQSLVHELGPMYYINGDASGNQSYWHGLLTLCKTNGNTINSTTGAVRSKDNTDQVAYAEGTYAGLNMALGTYGGDVRTAGVPWPIVNADSEYDFYTPLILNTHANAWSGATRGEELVNMFRYGIVHAQRNSSNEGQITNIWTDRSNWIDFATFHSGKEEIQVTNGGGVTLRSLGFRNVIVLDGVEVSWETAMPIGYFIGLNYNLCTTLCMTDSMFVPEGPEYKMETQSHNAVVSTLSNMKFQSPRNFLFGKPYAEI